MVRIIADSEMAPSGAGSRAASEWAQECVPPARDGGNALANAPGLSFARVEDLERVEHAAHGGLHGDSPWIEFAAHAVALQDPDAVLTGHGTAERDRRVEELLERRLGGSPGGVTSSGCKFPSPA